MVRNSVGGEMREKNMKTVEITMEGGVIQDIEVPKGVRVVVRDYDTDSIPEDELTKDDHGDDCIETIWE